MAVCRHACKPREPFLSRCNPGRWLCVLVKVHTKTIAALRVNMAYPIQSPQRRNGSEPCCLVVSLSRLKMTCHPPMSTWSLTLFLFVFSNGCHFHGALDYPFPIAKTTPPWRNQVAIGISSWKPSPRMGKIALGVIITQIQKTSAMSDRRLALGKIFSAMGCWRKTNMTRDDLKERHVNMIGFSYVLGV